MLATGRSIVEWVEQLAPPHLALPDDRIGLQLGTLNKRVNHVMVALEITDEVVEAAIKGGVDLIIAHHALIFRPLQRVLTDSSSGRRLATLIKHDIAVYVTHTNLDVAEGGVNDLLAEALGLQGTTFLDQVYEEALYKLAVFVPTSHQEAVQEALFNAGAGQIGRYSHCSFNIDGIGTFMPQEGTNPYSGQHGEISRESEVRVETIVPHSVLSRVVQAMIEAHPYEEVAYDVFRLQLPGKRYGIGRIGTLPVLDHLEGHVRATGNDGADDRVEGNDAAEEYDRVTGLKGISSQPLPTFWTLGKLAEQVKIVYDVPMLRVVGDLERKVRKVAIVGGSGSRYVRHALAAGADVLITGDIDYHTAQDALAAGLTLIDPGHNIERLVLAPLAAYIQNKLNAVSSETRVFASQVDTEPFRFV